jgi:fibronectin type 3 domain-containing protein
LSAKAAPHSVTVRWQAASSDKGSAPLRYNIYRSEDGGQSYICIARKVPDTSYSDTNVNGGKNYSYEVTSIDDKGHESARSAPIKVTVPN